VIALSAVVVAVLFACGVYLMLSRSTQWVAIGFILLSNAVNLFVLTAAGLPAGPVPPLLLSAEAGASFADPLPQAFILTAIVIGLGTSSFLLALAARAHRERGTDRLWDPPRGRRAADDHEDADEDEEEEAGEPPGPEAAGGSPPGTAPGGEP
jgi:multicomponent Na+:H+ antiporter subunit C